MRNMRLTVPFSINLSVSERLSGVDKNLSSHKRIARMIVATAALLLLPLTGQAQLDDPIPNPIKPEGAPIQLETVATGLTAPNWGSHAPGDQNRLFVTDQTGILWAIDLVNGDKSVFADLSSLLVNLGIAGPGTFDERGLLGRLDELLFIARDSLEVKRKVNSIVHKRRVGVSREAARGRALLDAACAPLARDPEQVLRRLEQLLEERRRRLASFGRFKEA